MIDLNNILKQIELNKCYIKNHFMNRRDRWHCGETYLFLGNENSLLCFTNSLINKHPMMSIDETRVLHQKSEFVKQIRKSFQYLNVRTALVDLSWRFSKYVILKMTVKES